MYREQLVGLLGFGPERLVVDEEVRYPAATTTMYLSILFLVYSIYTTVVSRFEWWSIFNPHVRI